MSIAEPLTVLKAELLLPSLVGLPFISSILRRSCDTFTCSRFDSPT